MKEIKLIAFSDVHENYDITDRIVNKTKNLDFDCFVFAGDLGYSVFWNYMLNKLGKPFLFIRGNWDYENREEFEINATNLHLNPHKIKKFNFIGFDGVIGTIGHTTEQILNKMTRDQKREYQKIKLSKNYVDSEEARLRLFRKQSLLKVINKKDLENVIVIAHQDFSLKPFKPILQLYGHIHIPQIESRLGVIHANVSVITPYENKFQIMYFEIDENGKINWSIIKI